MLMLEVGIVTTGLSTLLLGLTLTAGESVQTPAYFVQVALSHVLFICIGTEMVCLLWAICLMLISERRRPPIKELLKVFLKSLCVPALLHVLAVTRIMWVTRIHIVFFPYPMETPGVYLFDRYYRLSPAQGLGAALLMFGMIGLGWVAFVVVPLVNRVVRPPLQRSLQEDLKRRTDIGNRKPEVKSFYGGTKRHPDSQNSRPAGTALRKDKKTEVQRFRGSKVQRFKGAEGQRLVRRRRIQSAKPVFPHPASLIPHRLPFHIFYSLIPHHSSLFTHPSCTLRSCLRSSPAGAGCLQ